MQYCNVCNNKMVGVMSFSNDKYEKFVGVLSVIQKQNIGNLITRNSILEKN